jgi:hypothetical protein
MVPLGTYVDWARSLGRLTREYSPIRNKITLRMVKGAVYCKMIPATYAPIARPPAHHQQKNVTKSCAKVPGSSERIARDSQLIRN